MPMCRFVGTSVGAQYLPVVLLWAAGSQKMEMCAKKKAVVLGTPGPEPTSGLGCFLFTSTPCHTSLPAFPRLTKKNYLPLCVPACLPACLPQLPACVVVCLQCLTACLQSSTVCAPEVHSSTSLPSMYSTADEQAWSSWLRRVLHTDEVPGLPYPSSESSPSSSSPARVSTTTHG
jgi:hypothetical protein